MVGIQVCSNGEWSSLKELFKDIEHQLSKYPFGEFITLKFYDRECIFYRKSKKTLV